MDGSYGGAGGMGAKNHEVEGIFFERIVFFFFLFLRSYTYGLLYELIVLNHALLFVR